MVSRRAARRRVGGRRRVMPPEMVGVRRGDDGGRWKRLEEDELHEVSRLS